MFNKGSIQDKDMISNHITKLIGESIINSTTKIQGRTGIEYSILTQGLNLSISKGILKVVTEMFKIFKNRIR